MLEGQILEPGDFPWQDTEAQMVGQEAKACLSAAVTGVTTNELDESLAAMTRVAKELSIKREKEEEKDATGEPEETMGEIQSGDPSVGDTENRDPTDATNTSPHIFLFNRRRTREHE